MFFYNEDPFFGPKFFLFLFVLWLVMFLFAVVARRILKVEKKKMFSHNHLNTTHKRIDWVIRIIFILIMIIGAFINISRLPSQPILFLESYILLILLVLLTEIVRAVMEWKYAENRNAYVFTVVQLLFMILLLILIYVTDFFGLFGNVFNS